MRQRVDVGNVEPPRQNLHERGALWGCQAGAVVVADQSHPDRAIVETHRVSADDRLVHPAVAALEDLAVLVDEEVVADVVPAVAEHVVELDSADD